MTSQTPARTASTVILGGGGAVGVSWQIGLITGLRDTPNDPSDAGAVFGTSAGAVVGCLLAAGRDLNEATQSLKGLATSMAPSALHRGNAAFLAQIHDNDLGAAPKSALQRIGAAAAAATTLDQDAYLQLFDNYCHLTWPETFSCTAIDADTGELVVWDQHCAVPLHIAIAASCALPMLFPLVENNGHRYMDGGLLSHLNATAAPTAPRITAISCHPLTPETAPADRELSTSENRAAHELQQLSNHSHVTAFALDLSQLGAGPGGMMNPQFAAHAYQVGLDQATQTQ